MGALQELSLLTGIISKTALPGTVINNYFFPQYLLSFVQYFHIASVQTTFSHIGSINWFVLLGVSGTLERGEVNSGGLLEFQGHINRFQV